MPQLLVVAQPEYAKRIQEALEPTAEDLSIRVVATIESGLIALGEQLWDAVVIALRDEETSVSFPITEFVDLAHKAPIVVVTEEIGEDAAAQLMRSGASDVVSFRRIGRLPAVLDREWHEGSSILAQHQHSRAAQSWFASIIHYIPVGIVYHNERGEIVLCNETALHLLGLSEDELLGVTSLDPRWNVIRENGEDLPGSDHPSSVAARTKSPVLNVVMGVFRPKTNDRVWLRVDAIPVLDHAQRLAHVMVHFSDVTNLRRMVDTIRMTEERFRLAFEHSGIGMVIYSPKTKIIQANATACRIFGRSRDEVIGMRMEDVTHPDDVDLSKEKAEAARRRPSKSIAMEKRYVQPSGAIVHCLVTVDALPGVHADMEDGVVVSMQDITARKEVEAELKRLNAQLLQAKKMEALGILAGGMAHDFNNILAAITCSTDILLHDLRSLPNSGELPEIAYELQTAAQRASDLIRQIVMFGRQSNQTRIPVKLDRVIHDATETLRKSFPPNVEVRVMTRSSPTVLANAAQMQQIVTNLCTYACQSIEKARGTISVNLDVVTMDAEFAKTIPGLHEGHYARICVSDNGAGMDARTLDHIFEPLSSSESGAKGSGLTMAIVQGIVTAHEGAIRAQSTLGKGTSVEVWLPLTAETQSDKPAQKSASLRGNNEYILIVDDEESLARILGRLLQNLGYQVTVHTQSAAALDFFDKNPNRFDAALIDLHMPRPGGIDVARLIHAKRPDLPIFIMSGFSDALGSTVAEELGIVGILQKPVTRDTLATELRRIFDRPE
jgi:PAS domain S-box-containing protein